MAVDYKSAGVDIEAGNRAVALMKHAVSKTYTPNVLAGLGSFGGQFSSNAFAGMTEAVLVASTDGVGTKTKLAVAAGRYGGLGADIVNHCINDILVQGASPLFFLDYIAMGQLEPEKVAAVVTGAAQACQKLGVALLGGETAEMPGVYLTGELDLVGTIVGVVERSEIINGHTLQAGDVLVGLPSSGLHTNGYSLARKVLDQEPVIPMDLPLERLGGKSLFDVLLEPHREYVLAYRALKTAGLEIRGMAHITGGGLIENLPRVFPQGLGASVKLGSWPVPEIFNMLVERGQIDTVEAHRAFNMGIGYVFMLPAAQLEWALEVLGEVGEMAFVIGEMLEGSGVSLQ